MIYESNIDQVLANLKAKLTSVDMMDELCGEVALSLYASNQKRIITDGLNVEEVPIGRYSTKPIYINPKVSPVRFAPAGKKTNRKNKANPKTRYFAGGYKEFRGFIGRPNDKVNVDLSHKLKTDYKIYHVGPGHYQIGFNSEYGRDVSAANEKRFNCKIWGISVSDRGLIERIVKGFINRKMK